MTDKEYILAGKSTFTVQRGDGSRYTYRVIEHGVPGPGPWFVSLLVGVDNTDNYRYLGSIHQDEYSPDEHWYYHGRKSAIRESAPGAQTFGIFWDALTTRGESLLGWSLHRSGRCARCGRLLTVPESIEAGLGPICSQHL